MSKITTKETDMTLEREAAILEETIRKNGVAVQLQVAQEELAELIQAVSKYIRFRLPTDENGKPVQDKDQIAGFLAPVIDHIHEEMADVGIILNQLAMIFGTPDEWEMYKLLRMEALLANKEDDGEEDDEDR